MELKEIIQNELKDLKTKVESTGNPSTNIQQFAKIEVLESILEEYKNSPIKVVKNLTSKRTPMAAAVSDYSKSALAKSEKNDCSVRTFASAFEITYEEAHKFTKETFGRKDKKGIKGVALKLVELKEAFGKNIYPIGTKPTKTSKFRVLEYKQKNGRTTKMSVRRFLEKYSKGTYIVTVRKHMFTVKDGSIIGNYSDNQHLRTVVERAFKVR